MTPQQIEHCIIEDLPDAVIDVEIKRGATVLRVVSQKFAGRGQSERQRHVLSLLKQGLANGSLHISHLKLYSQATPCSKTPARNNGPSRKAPASASSDSTKTASSRRHRAAPASSLPNTGSLQNPPAPVTPSTSTPAACATSGTA